MAATTLSNDTERRRPLIGVRWWVDGRSSLHLGWPEPGEEDACQAVGWVAADRPFGVIEAPAGEPDPVVLRQLDDRFPGRRWFDGTWDEAEAGPIRAAA